MSSIPFHTTPDSLRAESVALRRLSRHLLGHEEDAEDAEQETWLAALRHPPEPTHAPSSWLARVARNSALRMRRKDEARRRWERGAARPEATPSTAEAVERMALRREIVDAVLALDEPYRTTIMLRFWDDLPSRDVAHRMGVPVATVRTRTRRALALLRDRLDHECGDRPAWTALLAIGNECATPTAATIPSMTSLVLTGVMLMITKAKFAAVAVMVGTVLPVTYYLLLEPAAAGLATSSRTPGGGDLVAPGESRPMSSVGDLPMRVTVPDHAVEPTTLGSLLVRVRWPDDKQPAEGVLVRTRYYNYGHDPLTDPSGLTNESGTLTLENLRPGRMFVQTYRGGSEGGQKVVTLRAGEMSEVQLEIPAGLNVHGVVEDRVGNPIANADIVVASFSGWSGDAAALTRSGADGSFHLRSLATYCHVGARTEDYAPSPLHSVRGSKGDEVRVRIVLRDAGGAIHGRILDPRGRVVRDATIQVGEVRTGFLQLPDGSDALPPMPVRTLSDSDGRFAAEGLAPGRTSVAVRVRALAPWFGTIDVVAGVDQEIVVDLRPAATLSGTARDERGQPVAEATVLAKSGDVAVFGTRAFGDRVAKTDREGNYRLEGIGPGELQLHAWSKQGEAETRLFAVAGQSLQWNPVMSIGLTLRGRIVDEHGEPVMATLDSGLRNPDAAHPWHQFHTTDKAGRFQLQNCIPGEAIWIRVQAGSHTGTIVSATPDQRDVLIRVKSLRKPSVYITGQVLTSDGKPAANCSFLCIVKGRPGFTMVGADVETGRFQHGPYAPGDYRLRINVSGHPPVLTDWKPLTDDETWDLGVIRLERPGFLQVHLLGDATLVPPHGLFAVRAVPEKNGNFLRVANRIRVQDGKAERSGPMAAGKYVLQVSGDRCHCAVHEFEIQPGQSTRMDVAFERGTPVTLRFEIETDTGMLPTWDPIAVEVKDNSGRVILVDSAHPPESKLQFAARPGKYMVTATAETGQRAEFLLTVGDTPAEPKCIVLR